MRGVINLISRFSRNRSMVLIVIIAIAALVVANIAPLYQKKTEAASAASVSKTTTADFNQGSLSGISTTGDQMTATSQSSWYMAAWSYRQKITLDHTKVPNTDQTNFPVLVKITDAGNGVFANAKSDGSDIRFTDADQTTDLNFEIEKFDAAGHELDAWVKIPTLSHTADTIIYMYYGNSSASAESSAFTQATWSNGYAGVWHLNSSSNATENDSTGNGNNSASNSSTATTGQIDGAASFNGSSNYIDVASSDSLNPSTITVSAWVNASVNNKWQYIAQKNTQWQVGRDDSGKYYLSAWNASGTLVADEHSATTATTGSWQYVVFTYDGSNARYYVNNSAVIDKAVSGNLNVLTSDLTIGSQAASNYFNGSIDDVQISSSARSADWIATEYANQNSPSTFESFGTQTAVANTWQYRQAITLDHTKVPNTDQTDFPVLVKITDSNNEVFSKAKSDGSDIRFTSSDTTTNLSFELEKFDASGHELDAWVKIPTLSHTTDTTIYMYYGNSGAAAEATASAQATWSNGYAGIYHLGDNAADTNVAESVSGNTANASANTSTLAATGKIDSGFNLTSNAYVDSGRSDPYAFTGDFSISFWMNTSTSFGSSGVIVGKYNVSDTKSYWIGMQGSTNFLYFDTYDPVGDTNDTYSVAVNDGNWHYVTAVRSGGNLYIYLDNYSPASNSGTVRDLTGTAKLDIGKFGESNNYYYTGNVEDVRLSSSARSSDWIATEYANQNSPSTFESIGNAESYYPAWYNTSWQYRQEITLDHTKVPNTDQTDFPVLVKITDANNTVFTGAKSDGSDIRFTSADQTTDLNFEIEKFDAAGHELDAWVKIPTLSHSANTFIYMYYGNASASAESSAFTQATWSNGYMGVYHLKESSNPYNDSTSNGNNSNGGTNPTLATGEIDGGQTFDGSSQYLTMPAMNPTYLTLSVWAKTTSSSSNITLAGHYDSSRSYMLSLSLGKIMFVVSPDGSAYTTAYSTGTANNGNWHLLTVVYDGSHLTTYIDGSVNGTPVSYSSGLYSYSGNASIGDILSSGSARSEWYFPGTEDEVRFQSSARSSDWIATEYANQNSPSTFETVGSEQNNTYYLSPTSTAGGSGIIDTGWNGGWGTPNGFSASVTIPSNTAIDFQMRSSAVGGSNDGDWTSWYDLGSASSSGTFSVATASMPAGITTGTNRYLQLAAYFQSTDGLSSPTLSDYTVYYLADIDPPANPTVSSVNVGGNSVTSGHWITSSGTVNINFSGATDADSGVAGYDVYFGTNSSADPSSYQAHSGAIGDTQTYSTSISSANDGQHFYFRLKTLDVAGNVSTAATLFDFAYDGTAPNKPSFVAATPAGYTTTNSFSFSWPAATDPDGAGGGNSGIQYYEYKTASAGSWSQTADSSVRTVSDILAYQEGANAFYVRSVDNAGNISSSYQQVTYYWSGMAPAKPTNLSVSPGTSDTNEFTISWDKPAIGGSDPPIVGYYYSINAAPTVSNVTYVASTDSSVSIGPAPYATLQGTNTVYVLAVDSAGNLSYESAYVASTTFNCQTAAPSTPTSVSLYDSSDRGSNRWMLTLQWVAGSGGSGSADHYSIERSTDGNNFSPIATTTGTAYIDDSDLNNSTTYYYQIKAVDNAGKESAASSIVHKMPTGNFTTPPTILSNPKISNIMSSSAEISWTTDRSSSSIVRYGTKQGTFDASTGQLDSTTNHSVTLLGLTPSVLYYFQVQSLDDARDYSPDSAYSTTYSFTTSAAPAISETKVSNITLSSADISFITTTVATSTINYGTSNTYGTSIEDISGAEATTHNVKLTNLTPGTTYHFKITGTDINNSALSSDDYQFDTLPLPKIDNLKIAAIPGKPQSAFTASWTTNVPTTTILNYKTGSENFQESSKSKSETDHQVEVDNLEDNSLYQIIASGRDSLGNLAKSDTVNFTTPFDTRPPVISSIQVETSNVGSSEQSRAQIVVSWQTDEPATSKIEYGGGTTGVFTASTSEDDSLVLSHTVIISDLDPTKPYHLKIESKDKAGNLAQSDNQTFVTSEAKSSIWDLILKTLGGVFGFIKLGQ